MSAPQYPSRHDDRAGRSTPTDGAPSARDALPLGQQRDEAPSTATGGTAMPQADGEP